MQYLEVPALTQLTSTLTGIDCGDSLVFGQLEAYSCKRAGSDRKFFKSLDQQFEELAKSPQQKYEYSISPFGPLSERPYRRTFISLIATLNSSYPDYDFSNVHPAQFQKELNLHLVVNYINTILASVVPDYNSLVCSKLWSSLDMEISPRECEVYSYIPNADADPFSEDGNIWCFNYFFYNRKMQRVLFFTCRATSKASDEPCISDDSIEEDEGIWGWDWEDDLADDIGMFEA